LDIINKISEKRVAIVANQTGPKPVVNNPIMHEKGRLARVNTRAKKVGAANGLQREEKTTMTLSIPFVTAAEPASSLAPTLFKLTVSFLCAFVYNLTRVSTYRSIHNLA